ncbi:MAG: hypothetical protein J7J06_06735 [Methanosarcinales archaeon]|nr:hypothetical protein [Methanosarcinales archaeon]
MATTIDFEREVGFIWDVDGVIVDSPHEMAWRLTAEMPEWGVPVGRLDSEFYSDHVSGRPRYEGGNAVLDHFGVYERFRAETDAARNELLERYCTQKNELFKRMVAEGRFKVFESSIALAVEANERGVLQAMASASKNAKDLISNITRDKVSRIIGKEYEHETLYSVFDVDASGLDGMGKREIFASAAMSLHKLSGGRIRRYVVFEDAPSGIAACKENGMFGVGVRRIGERAAFVEAGADVVVDDLGELGYDALRELFQGRFR